jgi:replication initiation and membrane attachment protein DnaB
VNPVVIFTSHIVAHHINQIHGSLSGQSIPTNKVDVVVHVIHISTISKYSLTPQQMSTLASNTIETYEVFNCAQ